ncbi:MAG TPA: electron transfer flavoprotein subunit beta/FixA family protein [Edaphocola sp.]|nr:electron transfer flavoprotein subunit beta/FixA family protein [Edaphocola sp.]
MKVLVCIAKAPDTTAKVSFTDNDTKFNEAGVTFIINPYDEMYALVRAIELKESGVATEIHLVSVGGADTDAIIRKALALGGDQAYRIDATSNDPYVIGAEIANLAKQNNYDIIFTGKESIDYNNGAVGATIAGILDSNYFGNVTKLNINGTTATVSREIEGGQETVSCNTPLVVACQQGVAEPRIPNMRGIMAARTKPLNVVPGTAVNSLATVESYEMPPAKQGVKLFTVDQVDDLVSALINDAKVL